MLRTALSNGSKLPWVRILPTELLSTCFQARALTTVNISAKPYYISTPIYYVNADPHIGHLHSMVIADVYKRYDALRHSKPPGLLVTGTDEHGLKIQRVAEAAGEEPIMLCDRVSQNFKALADQAKLDKPHFIRTTEQRHKDAVQHIWRILQDRGHIYKGSYQGWYSVSDEAYYSTTQVEETTDPTSGEKYKASVETGQRVEWVEEENYKFRLSSFQQPLIDWLEANPQAVVPSGSHASLLDSLRSTPLSDLSISRPAARLSWGIKVPDDPDHTIYVWIDALTNYLTAAGYPWKETENKYWPADLHVIGKDILRFHAIYWPAMLMACDLPLPKTILTHAHWTMNKFKMSKSRGNVADPKELLRLVGVDGVRWYLMRHGGNFASDSDYSLERVIETYNVELIGQMGNLIQRIRQDKLIKRLPSAQDMFRMPDEILPASEAIHKSLTELPELVRSFMDTFQPGRAMQAVLFALYEANKHIATLQPWLPSASAREVHSAFFYTTETMRIISHCIQPVMPDAAILLRELLGMEHVSGDEDLSIGGGRGAGQLVKKRPKEDRLHILFRQLMLPEATSVDEMPKINSEV